MTEINHFSHGEHPLILVADGEPDEGKDTRNLICDGCHEAVIINNNNTTSGGYYRCGGGCKFTLHKRCAELPPQIDYPLHQKHPLVLWSSPPSSYTNCVCDVCGRDGWKWFTYRCPPCEYDVDAVCALAHLEFQELLAQTKEMRACDNSEIHHHPLNLHLKPGKFFCDICLTEDVKDFPYICTYLDCSFSIHKRCAHAPPTLHLIHHHPAHPLHLSRSLPDMYYSFTFDCDICKKRVSRHRWIYYCANCRFFTHVNCAFIAAKASSGGEVHPLTPVNPPDIVDPSDPFMNLPFQDSDASKDQLARHFKDSVLALIAAEQDHDDGAAAPVEEDDHHRKSWIQHWAHTAHPLTLVDSESTSGNMVVNSDPITVCEGCVRPIQIPYYHCHDQCNFYLHQHCAKLPLTLLNHILHPNHPLQLKCFPDPKSSIGCVGCLNYCNKFLYQCDECEFYLDVNCAFLPQSIKHEKHMHRLSQCLVSQKKCDAYGFEFSGIGFRCDKANCSFLISRFYAMLPRNIWHRYDKEHSILLTYPPVKDHPQEFFCELCEEEIHPKYWMYHCSRCTFSFHTYCLYRRDLYLNVKWEGLSFKFDKHRHTLSYTRRKKNSKKYLCSLCNLDINGRLILKCKLCEFQICAGCWK